jgi:hypothetical protein
MLWQEILRVFKDYFKMFKQQGEFWPLDLKIP